MIAILTQCIFNISDRTGIQKTICFFLIELVFGGSKNTRNFKSQATFFHFSVCCQKMRMLPRLSPKLWDYPMSTTIHVSGLNTDPASLIHLASDSRYRADPQVSLLPCWLGLPFTHKSILKQRLTRKCLFLCKVRPAWRYCPIFVTHWYLWI